MMRSESEGSSSSVGFFHSCSSANPTSLPLPIGEYEVFLSFRGPDVRKSFADCLYSCLVRSKIHTFRDEEELRKGETISPSLIQAIIESKIYIPILTQNYAFSKFCLQELAKMVDCWKNGGGKGERTILPIFFFIDPKDVRHQDSGPYKEAFEQHSLNHDPETISEWKEALKVVGKMNGWHVTESDGQGAVIDKIFTEVESHLRDSYTLVTDELVGMDCHVEEVLKLLNLDSTSERIVGIHGIGGLGKTTLAKAVYNKVYAQFERCCFLDDIRDILSKDDGIVTLQDKMISDILKKDYDKVRNASDGIRIIRDRVCRHKVLIVLDDVDARFQFNDIFGKLSDFSVDSRFLITTRDAGVLHARLLNFPQECKLYEIEGMSHENALELFSKHAFGVDYPPKDYARLSEEFVQVAAGLPLALKVIGSLLYHSDKGFWEAKLIELKDIPPAKVQERLKISYDELTLTEKGIFLDVACLFVGKKIEAPIHMWGECDFYPASTIRTLVQRSLLKVKKNKVFWMHDHIRDLGRAIVRGENTQNPYKRSRIWSNSDAVEMLKHKEGTDGVEALIVDMQGEDYVLTNDEFKQMSRLRYLEVWHGKLAGNFNEILPSLCWLRLFSCDSIPTSIDPKKLVILELDGCSVRDGWKGWNEIKVAGKLKSVSLCRCYNLKEAPDFSNCRGLEFLKFSYCFSMRGELDIGNFKNLKGFEVDCTPITKLKGEIGMLQNLKKIDASRTNLIEVPAGIGKLSSLEVLDLTLPSPKKPDLTETLPDSLKSLSISSSFSSSSFPSLLNFLDVRYCKHLQRLPNLGNLTHLMSLSLYKVGIREIPGLEDLQLLEILSLQVCPVLEKLPSLATLTRLHVLDIIKCPALVEIHGLEELRESLSYLHISEVSGLTGIEALHSMIRLETLLLEGPELTNILPPSFSTFIKLRVLFIKMMSVKQFPDLSSLRKLKDLTIADCKELIEVPGLDTLESLEHLTIYDCRSIRTLPDLSRLIKLRRLNVTGCTKLTEIRGLERLESLEILEMTGCKSIKELPNLSSLKKLKLLLLRKCRQLKEVNGLEEMESLKGVDIDKRLIVRYLLKSVSSYGKRLVNRSVGGALFTDN